jgi:ATP-dependent RNA helicase SUPV3L1/SUV3
MFYKLAGFRFLGKRAVRIDILERLADLIRPLLQWKPGQGTRPDGAYDGLRFTTTTAMLSILGATLEDMEEILKGLGYRADAVKAEEATAFLATQDAASAPAAVAAEPAAEETAEKADHDDADGASEEAPAVEAAPAAAEAPAVAEASAEAGEAAEPKPVLLWRLGGRNENQRQARGHGERRGGQGQGQDRADRNNRRHGGEGGESRDGNRNNNRNRDGGNRDGNREGGNRDGGRPQHARNDRNEQRGDRQDRGDRKDRGDRNDRNNNRGNSQPLRFEAKPPRKEKPIDPDSPFAKLAALKEQMKK